MNKPACLSEYDYQGWVANAKGYYTLRYGQRLAERKMTDPCTDCLPEYRARMAAAGRCNQHNIEFHVSHLSGEPEVVGVRKAA